VSSGGENQVGRIVLRAWGCGAFRNDANEIAALFERALQNSFKGAYPSVTLAIGNALSDWNEAQWLNPSVELGRRLERVKRREC
jgi:uncharacterized protein (TIGR02452 family)